MILYCIISGRQNRKIKGTNWTPSDCQERGSETHNRLLHRLPYLIQNHMNHVDFSFAVWGKPFPTNGNSIWRKYIINIGKVNIVAWNVEKLLSRGVPFTFPLWFQSGGSSCPWGSRPVSKHVRNWSKWPPLGKCRGGLWIPSWLTKTTVPPLFTGGTHTWEKK